jgi:uncharacterized protein YdhG (YjbR/CyaY superfamily)
METMKLNGIDDYIAGFPKDIQTILEQIRAAIKDAAPDAAEAIRYGMPTFTLKGNLVHFAAFKNHVGFYPVPSGNIAFEKEFSAYKTSGKGTIQFPLNKPMPLDLIAKIVKFRVKESMVKSTNKLKTK